MKTHWTERSIEDYVFRIGADLIAQLEEKMEVLKISQNELAERLNITKGRVSQVFNHPGNITLGNIIRYTRSLGMKASIVAYEDGDPENKKGPINSDIFRICWEKYGKPRDFWAIQQNSTGAIKNHSICSNISTTPNIGERKLENPSNHLIGSAMLEARITEESKLTYYDSGIKPQQFMERYLTVSQSTECGYVAASPL
ncbi:MAG: XRE family transcriptional regulator [Proteobacteria bacterium]|nr:XRE family transcriptional regulator [Pseudomonadota bacterium]